MSRQTQTLSPEAVVAEIRLRSISFIVSRLHAGEILIGSENGKIIKRTKLDHPMTKHLNREGF